MSLFKIICLIVAAIFVLIHGWIVFEPSIFDNSKNLHWFQIWIIVIIWILLH